VSPIPSRVLLAAAAVAGAGLFIIGAGLVAASDWLPFTSDAETECADGSEVGFMERRANLEKVVLFFEGGGACFSAETCAFDGEGKDYVSSSPATPDRLVDRGGIFDAENPQNPLAGHSVVYVPYCTGDGHLGTASHRYSDDLTVQHKGFINATAALDHLVATYPDTTQLVVTGTSAGSIPTPLFAALAADRLPDARIVTLGDGSGGYPDEPVLNAYIGSLWGTGEAIPEWPETDGLELDDWSVPGLYVVAGRHAPDVTFARFDYAYDEAQGFYADLVGVAADELVTLIDSIEADIEAAGVEVSSYVAPGVSHTVLGSDEFYELEVEGVRLVDWVAALVGGETPGDVHCVDCD
jgi:hypothetical protein